MNITTEFFPQSKGSRTGIGEKYKLFGIPLWSYNDQRSLDKIRGDFNGFDKYYSWKFNVQGTGWSNDDPNYAFYKFLNSSEHQADVILDNFLEAIGEELILSTVTLGYNLYREGQVVATTVTTSVKNQGRAYRQGRLRQLAKDDKLGSADRGWLKQELNQIKRKKRSSLRNPPGKVLAHERGREAAKGYSYKYSNLQDIDLHELQHSHDLKGTLNKERPIE